MVYACTGLVLALTPDSPDFQVHHAGPAGDAFGQVAGCAQQH